MDTDLTECIYQDLKAYIGEKSKYNPAVLKKSLSNKFPLIVLTEANNYSSSATLKYKIREKVDTIYWEVNIYATDKTVGTKVVSNVEICDELKALVDNVMSNKYRLERLSCRPTPNLDQTIRRITMRYSTDILVNRKRII